MGACEMLNLVLKIFASLWNRTKDDTLLPLLLLLVHMLEAQGISPPSFSVWRTISFSENTDFSHHMHPRISKSDLFGTVSHLDLFCLPAQHLSGSWPLLEEETQGVFFQTHVTDGTSRLPCLLSRVDKHQHLVKKRKEVMNNLVSFASFPRHMSQMAQAVFPISFHKETNTNAFQPTRWPSKVVKDRGWGCEFKSKLEEQPFSPPFSFSFNAKAKILRISSIKT